MLKQLNLNNKSCAIRIAIFSDFPKKIRCIIRDKSLPNTDYVRSNRMLQRGTNYLYYRMPYCVDDVVLSFDGATINSITTVGLKSKWTLSSLPTRKDREMIPFIINFCKNAGVLSAGNSSYACSNGMLRIDYFDSLFTIDKDGKKIETKTPARVNKVAPIIEVNRKYFVEYTVPERIATLLHEYSHFYKNIIKSDEFDADENAITLYLGLGFPEVDIARVFNKIFANRPTGTNIDRYNNIKNKLMSNRDSIIEKRNYYYDDELKNF